MELLTQKIIEKLPKLGVTDGVPTKDKAVIVKFFHPTGNWTWYATEWDGEDLFFGLVDGFELEWGYFSLKELKSIRGFLGLGIERDMYFGMPKIKDIPALKGRV